jgi:uncharacterized coiled-coil protein SlyX
MDLEDVYHRVAALEARHEKDDERVVAKNAEFERRIAVLETRGTEWERRMSDLYVQIASLARKVEDIHAEIRRSMDGVATMLRTHIEKEDEERIRWHEEDKRRMWAVIATLFSSLLGIGAWFFSVFWNHLGVTP